MGLNYKGLTDGAVSIKNPKCAKNIVFTQGDIERYVRRWYLENDSAISKIFKYVYNRVYVSEKRLIRFITSLDSENPLAYKNHLTNKNKPHYHIFKIRKDGKIGIKRNIREYVEEIIKESD